MEMLQAALACPVVRHWRVSVVWNAQVSPPTGRSTWTWLAVGTSVGNAVGTVVGSAVGEGVGCGVGWRVGNGLGAGDGRLVGV